MARVVELADSAFKFSLEQLIVDCGSNDLGNLEQLRQQTVCEQELTLKSVEVQAAVFLFAIFQQSSTFSMTSLIDTQNFTLTNSSPPHEKNSV